MKELSIFVDESGDFGAYDHHCPIYLFSLVYHDQQNNILPSLNAFRQSLLQVDPNMNFFHTGPLIRREDAYKNIDIKSRRVAFYKMSYLATHLPINYSVVVVEKKHIADGIELSAQLSKPFKAILDNNLIFFQGFDHIKIYYDNGQKQLTSLLGETFRSHLNNIQFKIVKSADYVLFQVADFLSTIELTHYKFETKKISSSERYFFADERQFNRNYYRHILAKRL